MSELSELEQENAKLPEWRRSQETGDDVWHKKGVGFRLSKDIVPEIQADLAASRQREEELREELNNSIAALQSKRAMELADQDRTITQLRQRVAQLEGALRKAEGVFRQYADMHFTKGKPDKALRNQEHAERCLEAIKGGAQ